MYSLYSLSVVAATMRISPRASTDLKMFAASDGAPSAEPAPTIVCASSTNRIRFGRSFSSRMTFWIRSSNIPRSIVPATIVFICRLTTWQSRRRTGTLSGSNSMRRASPSAMAVLPTPGSPMSITELARSRWQRISSTCWISLSRPNTGGSLSWRASRFRLVAKCLRNGGSSNRFFRRSSRSSMSRIRVFRRVSISGSTPWRRRIDTGTPCVSSNTAEKRSAAFDGLPAGPAGVMQRQLEDELGRRRDAQLASGKRRHHVQVLFNRLKNGVRVQLDVPHHFREHVPLDLREREENVLVREQRMLAAAGFFDRPDRRCVARFRQSCSVRCRDLLRAPVCLRPGQRRQRPFTWRQRPQPWHERPEQTPFERLTG